MPAPPSTLLAALRAGSVSRHCFFEMDHSQGHIYAWDGIGTFTFNGNDYLGVAGYVQIDGISDSGDIQNHDIWVTLNGAGVPQIAGYGVLPQCSLGGSLATTDLYIRGRAATLTLAWLDENGTVIASNLILSGVGDIIKIPPVGDTFAVRARIRPPVAAWNSPPRAYYTPEDQAAAGFPSDTGFDYVANLQNSTASGWSNVAVIGNANIIVFGPSGKEPEFHPIQNANTGNLLGDDTFGLTVCCGNGIISPPGFSAKLSSVSLAQFFEEETTAVNPVGSGSAGGNLLVSGSPVTIDGSGVARTALGKRILGPSQDATRVIREQALIASLGSLGTETFATPLSGQTARQALQRSGAVNARFVYDNKNGASVFGYNTGGNAGLHLSVKVSGVTTLLTYVEDVTGTAVTCNPTLQVGGSNCKLSTTGIVLSPLGHKIVLSGGDPTQEYLRVWI